MEWNTQTTAAHQWYVAGRGLVPYGQRDFERVGLVKTLAIIPPLDMTVALPDSTVVSDESIDSSEST
jgi:hypothetical protein